VSSGPWFSDAPNGSTLPNVVDMATRVGGFVVGGTGGGAGFILVGLLLLGIVAGIMGDTVPGAVGGAVLGLTAVGAVVQAGYFPRWLWAMMVFVIGIPLATILIRALR